METKKENCLIACPRCQLAFHRLEEEGGFSPESQSSARGTATPDRLSLVQFR